MRSNILDQPLFRLIVPSFYGLMIYILILLINNSLYSLTESIFTNELLLCVIMAYLISEPIRWIIRIFESRKGQELKKADSIFLMLGVNFLLGGAITFVVGYIYFTRFENYSFFSVYQNTLLTLTVIYALSAVFYTIFFLSVFFLSVKNDFELKKEDLKRQNLDHQLEIFNNQINPDLLFQSLETLISLVHHNRDEAEDFLDRLSQFYRAILDNRKKELIPLQEELRSCKDLIYLFQARFLGQVGLQVKNKERANNTMVVPGAVSMVLDCIINGSIISKYQPLEIVLDCDGEEGYMVISHRENKKLGNSRGIKHSGCNLHEAYAFFSDKPVIEISAYGDTFIKIPLINLPDAK